jgi:hypothetical protein
MRLRRSVQKDAGQDDAGLKGELLEVIEGHIFLLPGRLMVVHWFERRGNVTRPCTLVIDVRGTEVRVRGAVQGPDGSLYVLTSNRDGRGAPRSGDDRVLASGSRR